MRKPRKPVTEAEIKRQWRIYPRTKMRKESLIEKALRLGKQKRLSD